MPEPTGSAGGSLTNSLMGIFRERTRAQKQLELMAYQSAMGVAANVAKTKLGGQALTEAMKEHYETAYDSGTWRNPQAQKTFQAHLEGAGVKRFGVSGFEAQAIGNYPRAERTKEEEQAPGTPKVKRRKVGGEPTTPPAPVVNEAAQTVVPPNVGQRAPKASKGGFVQPALFTPKGNVTKAAKPAVRKPRVKKPGTGQTPSNPPMGGMNA